VDFRARFSGPFFLLADLSRSRALGAYGKRQFETGAEYAVRMIGFDWVMPSTVKATGPACYSRAISRWMNSWKWTMPSSIGD